jgi:molybdopterin synthase catalytic subunit
MNAIGLHRKGEVDLNQIHESFSKHTDSSRAGAIASFIGVVREDPLREGSGKVSHLEYEAYEEFALKRLEEIRRAMLSRPGIIEVSIHHVIDKLGVGEPSLFVAVLGGHRQQVFPVLAEIVERVKKEVPIWKKEYTSRDAYWVSNDLQETRQDNHLKL